MLSWVQSSWQASSFSSILESESPLVLNSCPTEKNSSSSTVCFVAKPLLWNVQLPKRWFSVVLYKYLKHTAFHDTQTKRLSHILVQLCGLYTNYTFIKNDVPCRWAAQLCKKRKVPTLQTHGGIKRIKQLWSWSLPLFCLHGILKRAFTFLKDSSNDLPTMISTFLLLWSLSHTCTHISICMCTHTHTKPTAAMLSFLAYFPPWQDWKFNVNILHEITVEDGHFIFTVCHMAHILPITQPASQAYGPSYQDQQ